MKKFTLVSLAMMASASCFAQTTLWNGEDKNSGLWDRCNPETVDNPLKEGVNTTDKCAKFTITGTNWDNGDIVLDLKSLYGEGGLDMTKSKRLSIMVKKSHSSNVKIELSAGANTYTKRIASWCDGGDKWQKLVFDFTTNCDFGDKGYPTELAIYPGIEDGQESSQEIYVDNIVLEDIPTVNGKSLWDFADGSLTGKLELTGGYFKSECSNVDNGWEKIYINDFDKLNEKLSADVTSIDMRKASTLGVDINQFFKNPNTIVYADDKYGHNNVVVKGTVANLVLTADKAFNAPEDFTAESVKLTRSLQNGINSFVLPFEVTADELGASKVAIFDNYDKDVSKKAYFNPVAKVAANTPFLTMDVAEDKVGNELNFGEKKIVATPESLGTDFVGVYAKTDANGMYGINKDGKLQKGGVGAYVDAFHAYLNVTNPAGVAFNGSTPTAINGVTADKTVNTAVYDLSGRRVNGKLHKGLYIINGKKVVVK